MRYLSDPRIVLEVALVKIARLGRTVDIQRLLDRLDAFEGNLSGGGASPSAAPSAESEPSKKKESTLFRKKESAPVTASAAGGNPARTPAEQPGPDAGRPPAASEPKTVTPPAGASTNPGDEIARAAGPDQSADTAVAGAPPAEGNGFLETARNGWRRIVKEIRAKSPRVAGCLRGARPVAYDRGTLVIGVPHTHRYQHTALEKRDENQLLASAATEILGTRVKVRCELYEFQDIEEDEPPPEPEDTVEETEEEPVNEDTLREEHPILGTLLDRFEGRIVAVRNPREEKPSDQKEDA
jgi:DNA polymerase-3 subunit gamma/tau